jgi:hypothetical protein
MQYYRLRFDLDNVSRPHVVQRLMRLRTQLDAEIPAKDATQNLLLATWNIRDLGKSNRRGFGDREPESHFYIAEILSRFDFCAVQEVNDLPEWQRIMNILGPDYDYIATDVTDVGLGGNGERLTYLWDRRKVWFQKIAGELVLPSKLLISKTELDVDGDVVVAGKQFRRTPFAASFQSGWFKFDICTVHLYYGAESGQKLQERIEEIDSVASFFGARSKQATSEGRSLILLGDFNIVHPEHATMLALTKHGFRIPKALNRPTNINKSKYYDQIAFQTQDEVLEYVDRKSTNPLRRNAGIFETFEAVYRSDSPEEYRAQVRKSPNGAGKGSDQELDEYYLDWRTYQLSDHKPMWVRLSINDSDNYLARMLASSANAGSDD